MTGPRRPRIAVYDPFTPGEGGLYRYVQGVVSGLDPARYDVIVFCHPNRPFTTAPGVRVVPVLPYSGRPHEAVAEGAGTPCGAAGPVRAGRRVRAVAPPAARLVAGYVRSAVRIARLFRRPRFDLVHTFETDADPAALAARIAGVQVVVYTYQVDSTYRPDADRAAVGHRLIETLTDRCLTRGIAASEATRRDRLRRTHPGRGRIVTIPNGIDADRFRRTLAPTDARRKAGLPNAGELLVGTVGRLHEHKGQEYLVRGFGLLAPSFPTARLVVVGSGPLEPHLRAVAAEAGVADRVLLLGQRSDVAELLQGFDVFALPSVCEALPYALLEAMAVGLPAVATAVGGVAELIEHGRSGYVARPRDPTGLAARLRPLLESPALRAAVGSAARQRVADRFHEPVLIARTIALYDRLLGRCRAGATPC